MDVASTVSGAMQFGSTWRHIVYSSELPSTREDSMNSFSQGQHGAAHDARDRRRVRQAERQDDAVLVGPTTASSPSASSRPGKASRALLKAMMMRSVQRTKPVSVPISVPATMAKLTVSRLIQTLLLAPAREARQLVAPELVGAEQEAAAGRPSRAAKLIFSGSCGVHSSP